MALSNVRWEGIEVVNKMADTLPDRIANKKMGQAFRYALKPTLSNMRSEVTQRTGRLWYSIAITVNTGTKLSDFVGIVGPRRKRGAWNQRGWHAHLVEEGTKRHVIKASKGKMMPVFAKGSSGPVGYAKKITHPGSRGKKPFGKSIDATWAIVANRVADKSAEILRNEISDIQKQYGNVARK